jgi:hypothetical protein
MTFKLVLPGMHVEISISTCIPGNTLECYD